VRILVTGGAGFIGSHVVDMLIDGGHDVRVVDSLIEHAHRCEPGYLNPGADYVTADIADPVAVARAVRGVDAVCHQAAMVGQGTDLRDAPGYARHNDLGTAVLLSELAGRGFAGRFVLASSMVVYGEGGYRCPTHGAVTPGPRTGADLDGGHFESRCPECDGPLDPRSVPETASLDPRNLYAATKVHQEHLCACFARESPATVIALRYHNVYGPRMPRDTPYAGVASIFASSLARGEAPRVYEDGGQLRDFVHVRDVARANVLALTAPSPAPGPFNIASGRPRSILEMARALAVAHAAHATPAARTTDATDATDATGVPEPVVTGDYRLGDVRHVFASADRARSGLGFTAREDFAAGMAQFAHAPLRSP
jgi:dTDP-L-rhamnose 4-epimerase